MPTRAIIRPLSSGTVKTVTKVITRQNVYIPADTLRFLWVIFFHCCLGPTRKMVDPKEVTLPREYNVANRRGLPASSSPKEPKDDKVIMNPIKMHTPNPIKRSFNESWGKSEVQSSSSGTVERPGILAIILGRVNRGISSTGADINELQWICRRHPSHMDFSSTKIWFVVVFH